MGRADGVMIDWMKHALGMVTEEDRRLLREQTPGTWDYSRAVEAAMREAGYDDARTLALRGGLASRQYPLSVYRNGGGWQVDEWPYDRASVPLAEWRPSERFLAHMAAEGQG